MYVFIDQLYKPFHEKVEKKIENKFNFVNIATNKLCIEPIMKKKVIQKRDGEVFKFCKKEKSFKKIS